MSNALAVEGVAQFPPDCPVFRQQRLALHNASMQQRNDPPPLEIELCYNLL